MPSPRRCCALRLIRSFFWLGYASIGALLSSFMNNVGALALVMPIAIAGARKGGYSAALLLMPLSFATLLGGTTTLIGTPPNLLMADLAERLRGEPFTMFEFTPVGAAMTIAGIVFMVAIGWRLLPARREGTKSPNELFEIGHYVTEARLPAKSTLIGKTIREFEDSSGDERHCARPRARRHALAVELVVRAARGRRVAAASRDASAAGLRQGGAARSRGCRASRPVATCRPQRPPCRSPSEPAGRPAPTRALPDTAEVVVTPTSWVQGSTARTLRLRARYDTNLLAISRRGRPIITRLRDVPLFAGDVLLLEGPAGDLPDIIAKLGCLPLADRKLLLSPRRVLLPFAVLVGAVLLVILDVTSPAIAFVLGAATMVALSFVPAREVYSTIEWPVIVLLAALIPVAGALETTGMAQLAADGLVAVAGSLPPQAMLGLVMVATMAVTPILNNAATVLLMGPIAHGVAENIGVDSAAFLMAVAIGASCDFLTPFGHQNNTLILGPGGYRFADFWKLGLPIWTPSFSRSRCRFCRSCFRSAEGYHPA